MFVPALSLFGSFFMLVPALSLFWYFFAWPGAIAASAKMTNTTIVLIRIIYHFQRQGLSAETDIIHHKPEAFHS
jgi:hypothetical protein